jgi:flagellar hook-associated protein FlgK
VSDLLGLGSSGVLAYQRALVTVSNNIANVATEGYSRQEALLVSMPPRPIGTQSVGMGVLAQTVRRQYDEFAESNLRQSSSNLTGQAPLVQYAGRVLDLMAGQQTGLVGAMARFFDVARDVTADPASPIYRASFLGEAGTLATSVRQLRSQIDDIDTETRGGIDNAVARINTLSGQIALVNRQLQKRTDLDRQPPELLDHRDRLLRDLSEVVQIRTSFELNGEVSVSVGQTASAGLVVDRGHAIEATAMHTPSTGRVELQLGPRNGRETVAGLTGGEVGGLLAFREQVLAPTRQRLDDITSALIDGVNGAHRGGMDLLGQVGGDLFGVEPGLSASAGIRVLVDDANRVAAAGLFRAVADPANVGTATATVDYVAPVYDGPAQSLDERFASVGLDSPPQEVAIGLGQQAVAVIPAGLRDAAVYFDPAAGQWPQVFTRDGRHLLGSALTVDQKRDILALPGMTPGSTYSADYVNVGGTSEGYRGADYFMGVLARSVVSPSYDPLTGEVVGTAVAPARIEGQPMATSWPAGGIGAGALVLNGTALPALATPSSAADVAAWINDQRASTGVVASATQAVRLPAGSVFALNAVATQVTLKAEGAGYSQAQIVTPDGGWASVDDLAAAINAQAASSGVWAHVSSHGDLVFTNPDAAAVTIGGDLLATRGTFGATLSLTAAQRTASVSFGSPATALNGGQPFALVFEEDGGGPATTINVTDATPQGLVDAVNAAGLGVMARLVDDGSALPWRVEITGMTQGFTVRSDGVTSLGFGASSADTDTEIRLGLGAGGTPDVLTGLGLRTGVYWSGQAPEDLVVLLSGEGRAQVTAAYQPTTGFDRREGLRGNAVAVEFSSPTRYQVVDVSTGTVLAERGYDPNDVSAVIDYRGLQLRLTRPPLAGDRYTIDGNRAGVGDNRAMLRLAALGDEALLPGQLTLQNAYLQHTSGVGTVARQATIAEEALSVVYEQSVQLRENVAGVNLDEEAADLIRLQQAYQASARVMQTATTMFDTLLQIR